MNIARKKIGLILVKETSQVKIPRNKIEFLIVKKKETRKLTFRETILN